jgi:hypothetical protein
MRILSRVSRICYLLNLKSSYINIDSMGSYNGDESGLIFIIAPLRTSKFRPLAWFEEPIWGFRIYYCERAESPY